MDMRNAYTAAAPLFTAFRRMCTISDSVNCIHGYMDISSSVVLFTTFRDRGQSDLRWTHTYILYTGLPLEMGNPFLWDRGQSDLRWHIVFHVQ